MTGSRRALLVDVLLMVAAFVIATVVAEAAGAPNLGTAMTFGQLGFAAAAFYVIVNR